MFSKGKLSYNTRRIHRYLGVLIGVQFLLWTLGGLYFSWNNMDDVHGETLLIQEKPFFENVNFSKIQRGLDSLYTKEVVDSVHSVKLVSVLDTSFAQLKYFQNHEIKIQLIDVKSGLLRDAFSGQECLEIAESKIKDNISVKSAEFLDKSTTGSHHEYRGKPLPAYAFTLDHPSKTTIYVAAELGEITSVRNNNWRRFDFLWMLHTMDYSTRDHITNWLLRLFSILGLLTIASGFYLFYLTSPTLRKIKKSKK